MSSKIKVDVIENVAGSGNVSLGSGHNLVVPGNITGQGTLGVTGVTTMSGALTINTASNGLPSISLQHSNSGADNFQLISGTPGVANSGFSIRDTDAAVNRLIIDTNGVLLVGKTVSDGGIAGHEMRPTSFAAHTISGGTALVARRMTNDGTIALFQYQGGDAGYIGTGNGGDLYIGNSTTGFMFAGGSNAIIPTNQTTLRDNAIDLGHTSYRFDDIYATNGTIQTSDETEKQNIASLTSAEITAATAISKLFKTYKWKDKVAAKGDDARTHTGVVAQQVETAMSDAGLDASKYAFFISTTWWETQTEVAAVEADEKKGIEAADAYTRTDTYDTADEAPEGATERNRKGIRYPELLSFVSAATEQRLTSIETRLTALEEE